MYKKTRTLSVPVSPEVAAFAVVMEARLALEGYDEVEKWEGISTDKLMKQLEMKAKRLAAADPTNATELFNKAVIIGNLAMMLAEKSMRAREVQLGPEVFETQANIAVSDIVPELSSGVTDAPHGVDPCGKREGNSSQNAKPPRQFRPAPLRR